MPTNLIKNWPSVEQQWQQMAMGSIRETHDIPPFLHATQNRSIAQ